MLSDRIQNFTHPTIFQEVTGWVRSSQSTDIATGAPTQKTPQFIKDRLQEQLLTNNDQYNPPQGNIPLRTNLAEKFKKELNDQSLDLNNIYIGSGASGVLTDLAIALINPGDEVIVFDPHFPHQGTCNKIHGANILSSKMIYSKESQNWELDYQNFESLLSEKTKSIILCSPHNPSGKIYTREEYQKLGEILRKFPKVIIQCDDVYDYLVFDNIKYSRFAEVNPDLAQRTVTIGSLGKLFNCTGWRCGFAVSQNKELIKGLLAVNQNSIFGIFGPGQFAYAKALENMYEKYENHDSFLQCTSQTFQANRDFIQKEFSKIPGFDWEILGCYGGYFILIDIKNMIPKIPLKYFYANNSNDDSNPCNKNYDQLENPDYSPDTAFVKFLIYDYNVAIMPTSSFFIDAAKDNSLIRICLAKQLPVYQEALQKLSKSQ